MADMSPEDLAFLKKIGQVQPEAAKSAPKKEEE